MSSLSRPSSRLLVIGLVSLGLMAGGTAASAQEEDGPPPPPHFTCDMSGQVLETHSLHDGELSSPVTCTDTTLRRQTFVAPKAVTGTLTVSESVRKALHLASKRVASGTFSGPSTKKDGGRAYAYWWIRPSRTVRSRIKHVRLLGFHATFTVTAPDGTKQVLKGDQDGYDSRITGFCKVLFSGRLNYACKG